jgi:hypothetical protein
MNGHFIISLDYELHWGICDHSTIDDYRENLTNVNRVIDKLIALSDLYNVKLTFATVGFLFAKDKAELITHAPKTKPQYSNSKLNPYLHFNDIGNNEIDDPFHYASSMVEKINVNKNHEIGTHTFSHYYCDEHGQTINHFEADINAAKHIANTKKITLESIVFPRNMVADVKYLEVSYKLGIKSYRGTEKAYMYNIHPSNKHYNWIIFRLLRILDCYINITGKNTYNLKELYKKDEIINLPSSRLLRPYFNILKFLEPLKIIRIKKGMRRAAKKNELFHLWWHPHNFGKNIEENFKNLEKIFKEYEKLNKKYNFSSETMTSLTNKMHKTYA